MPECRAYHRAERECCASSRPSISSNISSRADDAMLGRWLAGVVGRSFARAQFYYPRRLAHAHGVWPTFSPWRGRAS
eukprot:scaffold13937_cov108-Isochrysis_galbana.AAC.7